MALKFLNKKGWHPGSLRNIEIVWKAEQKHEAEQKKLEELKKQIEDEREAQEFRLLQEQAGLVPKQERLDFLYDSGLAVGKSSADEYLLGKPIDTKESENDLEKAAAAPGALFVEEKPQSANEKWRKIHSDPLLLIRQQEQAALARIKNNPVKMGLIKKSIEDKLLRKEKKRKEKKEQLLRERERKRKRSKLANYGDSSDGHEQNDTESDRGSKRLKHLQKDPDGCDESKGRISHSRGADASKNGKLEHRSSSKHHSLDSYKRRHDKEESSEIGWSSRHDKLGHSSKPHLSDPRRRRHDSPDSLRNVMEDDRGGRRSSYFQNMDTDSYGGPQQGKLHSRGVDASKDVKLGHRSLIKHHSPDSYKRRQDRRDSSENGQSSRHDKWRHSSSSKPRDSNSHRRRHDSPDSPGSNCGEASRSLQVKSSEGLDQTATIQKAKYQAGKLSAEEKAARLREMQLDAEAHEEQRWHRIKKASDDDACQEARARVPSNASNFLDQTARNIYGTEKMDDSSVTESVRRRTHFIERSLGDSNVNTFLRS